jgi:hypothetical protein
MTETVSKSGASAEGWNEPRRRRGGTLRSSCGPFPLEDQLFERHHLKYFPSIGREASPPQQLAQDLGLTSPRPRVLTE